ncbi:coiled-coil domain-containing protein [Lignipirellula cremea]|uniref:hypothetical protein n=1 Tax=Lignipirellula cremea TaxID=2528010 RepID=UPI0011A253DF|nr:hypothetical protein [Lignipirellula cremea]
MGLIRFIWGRDELTSERATFEAEKGSWERAGQDRTKALDTWRQIQTEVEGEISLLRETETALEARIEQLATEKSDSQLAAARAQEKLSALHQKLDLGTQAFEKRRAEYQQLQAQFAGLQGQQTQIDRQISNLEANKASETTKLATLQESVALQQQLLEDSRVRFEAIEMRVALLDKVLETRTQAAARLKLDQEQLVQLGQQKDKLQTEIADVKASQATLAADIATAEKSLEETKKDVAASEAAKAALTVELSSLQSRFVQLKKQELELNTQLGSMTTAMNTLAVNAADVLKELAAKSAEVQAAIAALQIPSKAEADMKDAPASEEMEEEAN